MNKKKSNKMSEALTFIDPTKESLRLVYVIVPPLTNSGSSPVYYIYIVCICYVVLYIKASVVLRACQWNLSVIIFPYVRYVEKKRRLSQQGYKSNNTTKSLLRLLTVG